MVSGRAARITGAVVGTAAAAAAAGLAAERYAVGRARLRPDAEGSRLLHPRPALRTRTVESADGVALHVEELGDLDAAMTVVFVHGWVVEMASWHFQRWDLADQRHPVGRCVFYDQRGHGRSGTGAAPTIELLGADLYAVLEAVAPRGPVVLAGQSMGGMAILALARAHPELFGPRVVGVALVATAAGGLAGVTLGLPRALAAPLRRATPQVLERLRRHGKLVDRGRAAGNDLSWLVTRWSAFGSGEVSPAVVDLMHAMVGGTPIEVVADFYAAIMAHDERAALPVLGRVETLVVCGTDDRLTPPAYSRELAAGIPGAELVLVPGAGHMVMMERPDVVSSHLRSLVRRVQARAGAA